MARRWMCVALTASWLGLCATAGAQPAPVPTGEVVQSWQPPTFQGPKFVPPPPVPLDEPPFEGPSDNTQFVVPMYRVGFEYLLWWTQKSNLPPLVTRGSSAADFPGALGQPGTRILVQGGLLDNDHRHNGARLTFGIGLDESETWSFVSSFFFLESNAQNVTLSGDGASNSDPLERPLFDTSLNTENSLPVAFPNLLSGSISVTQQRKLYGGDVAFRYQSYRSENSRCHWVLGGKALLLDERLSIDQFGTALADGFVQILSDSFTAYTRFYGGLVGVDHEFRVGPFFLASTAKVSLGVSNVKSTLRGSSTFIQPNGTQTVDNRNGVLVSQFNSAIPAQSKFAYVPEGGAKFGLDLNQYIRLSVGYSAMYISEVARAGDLVNRRVNAQLIGAGPPLSSVPTSGFVVQGLDAALRFSY